MFILLLLALPVFADLVDHLRPVVDQLVVSSVRNVDRIYMINLDERPEKLASTLEKLAPYGIAPCRFSAINGWTLPLKTINEVGVIYEPWMLTSHLGTVYDLGGDRSPTHELVTVPGRNYFCHCMALGTVGCALSHLSVLQHALDSGCQTIWVLEDDIEIIQNPHQISDLIEELDRTVGEEGWDILFTDRDTKNQQGEYVSCFSYAWRPNYVPANPVRFTERKDVGDHFMQIGARYGAYSMIVRRSGIKKILNFLKCYQIFLPFDMEYTLPANIRLFCLKGDIVSTLPRALSDNGAPNYMMKP